MHSGADKPSPSCRSVAGLRSHAQGDRFVGSAAGLAGPCMETNDRGEIASSKLGNLLEIF